MNLVHQSRVMMITSCQSTEFVMVNSLKCLPDSYTQFRRKKVVSVEVINISSVIEKITC